MVILAKLLFSLPASGQHHQNKQKGHESLLLLTFDLTPMQEFCPDDCSGKVTNQRSRKACKQHASSTSGTDTMISTQYYTLTLLLQRKIDLNLIPLLY